MNRTHLSILAALALFGPAGVARAEDKPSPGKADAAVAAAPSAKDLELARYLDLLESMDVLEDLECLELMPALEDDHED